MSCECDRCGLEDPDCQCYVIYLEARISSLEERLALKMSSLQMVKMSLFMINMEFMLHIGTRNLGILGVIVWRDPAMTAVRIG